MRKITAVWVILAVALSVTLTACGGNDTTNTRSTVATVTTAAGETTVAEKSTKASEKASASDETTAQAETRSADEAIVFPETEEGVNTLAIELLEGTPNCYSFDGQILTFSGLTADTVCSVSGEFDGQIVVDAGDDNKFELELSGATIFNSSANPITVLSGDKFTLSAKKDTQNYILDTREAVDSTDETAISAAVYAECDTDVEGKGTLTLLSANNNGIHTKDDLNVKNLTLLVSCMDNALKGNDSVTIESGTLCLIAMAGDAVKTTNTDVSSKGNQRGIVTVSGGTVALYAACDGIDAAYDADISGDAVLDIHTDSYSPYSTDVEATGEDESEDVRYIRFNLDSYQFSVKYYNSDDDYRWANATYYKTVSGGYSSYYYYKVEKLTGYEQVQIYIYSEDQKQGQDEDYLVCSDYMTWNTAYDTFAMEARGQSISYNWTNYSTSVEQRGRGGFGGMGGMSDGNSDKGEYSTKGIKAGNEVRISGGTIHVEAYDDAIHANADTTLENGETPTGNVTISGGTLTLLSRDDGVHADGELLMSGGSLTVTGSYEGMEGTTIVISGGEIDVTSSDDGMNATATSGTGITFLGGSVFIYAGGDGIDSNSKTQYQGISFAGGDIRIVSTTSMNSSIDTEQGYVYTGGSVLAVCPAGGMTGEVTNCKNFSSVGTKTSLSLKEGQVLSAKDGKKELLSLTMPCSLSGFVVYLGESGASLSAE